MPRPCVICGAKPRVVSTIHGTYYVICVGHAETYPKPLPHEAITAWNSFEFEPPRKPITRVHHFRPADPVHDAPSAELTCR